MNGFRGGRDEEENEEDGDDDDGKDELRLVWCF